MPSTSKHAVAQAYADHLANQIPKEAYLAFKAQYYGAIRRGIAWNFTLPEWWAWWMINSNWERRGTRRGQCVMARYADVGPYSPENVYCATHHQNAQDCGTRRYRSRCNFWWNCLTEEQRQRCRTAPTSRRPPSSRSVKDPWGRRFKTAALAAKYYQVSRHRIDILATSGYEGWHWECDSLPREDLG